MSDLQNEEINSIPKKKKRRGKPQNRNQQKARANQANLQVYTTAKYPFLLKLNLDMGVVGKVNRLLDSVVSGSTNVVKTPLLGDTPLDHILSRMDKLFIGRRTIINDVLMNIETKQRGKVGPRSVALPWRSREDSTLDYFGSGPYIHTLGGLRFDNLPDSNNGNNITSHKGSLQPISRPAAIDKLKNSTNSGLPFYTRKSLVKDQILDNWDYLLGRKDPCILFTRTQEAGKTRSVWGYPIVDSAHEMQFYSPLLEYQKKLPWRSALVGPEYVAKNITNMMMSAKFRNRTLMSVDFAAYDASVKKGLQKQAFDYIKFLYGPHYHAEIDAIFHRFNTISLITPDGVIPGPHGVPSGSTFTNEIDSIAQYLIAMDSNVVNSSEFQIQGDDGVYSLADDQFDRFLYRFQDNGLKLSVDKSVFSKDYCIYLQNLYHIDYVDEDNIIRGIYPIYRALGKILYQERYTDFESVGLSGADYFTIRTISILENCKNHPLFEEFVELIIELDSKNSLLVNQETVIKYSKLMGDTMSTGALNNQYGDNLRGFSTFETVKVINKLRNKVV